MEKSKLKSILFILALSLIVFIILFALGMNLQKPGDNKVNQNALDNPATENTEEILLDPAEMLQEAVVLVEGVNPISKDGLVITEEGEIAKNDLEPMSEGAPRQTTPISKNELPSSAINLEVSLDQGWNPKEFRVKAGEPILLSVTPVDNRAYIFAFQDDSLSAIAVGTSFGETRAITFNAPDMPGEYPFYSNTPNYQIMGLEGVMIVE